MKLPIAIDQFSRGLERAKHSNFGAVISHVPTCAVASRALLLSIAHLLSRANEGFRTTVQSDSFILISMVSTVTDAYIAPFMREHDFLVGKKKRSAYCNNTPDSM